MKTTNTSKSLHHELDKLLKSGELEKGDADRLERVISALDITPSAAPDPKPSSLLGTRSTSNPSATPKTDPAFVDNLVRALRIARGGDADAAKKALDAFFDALRSQDPNSTAAATQALTTFLSSLDPSEKADLGADLAKAVFRGQRPRGRDAFFDRVNGRG